MNPKTKYWLITVALMIALNSFAQDIKLKENDRINSNTAECALMHNVFLANEAVSYISFYPKYTPIEERSLELGDGEGKNGYILEALFNQNFQIFKSAPQHIGIFKDLNLSFNLSYLTRMANDYSHPLLPSNLKIGESIKKMIWIEPKSVDQKDNSTTFLYFQFRGVHYSNGQQNEVFADKVLRRNNYRNGDFSTNYGLVEFTLSKITTGNSILTASLGYRQDIGWDDAPISFRLEQENSYGRHRLTNTLQWRSHPLEIFKMKSALFGRHTHKDFKTGKSYTTKSLYEIRVRTEIEAIMGNLSAYPHESKYPLSGHFYFQINPMRTGAFGLMLHTFVGRDYLNIRYDDIVWAIQTGITFNIDRYVPIGYNKKQSFIKEIE